MKKSNGFKMDYPIISNHASIRAAQRGICLRDVEFVIQFGECISKKYAEFYFLGKKDLFQLSDFVASQHKLLGIVVVVSPGGKTVMTTYKDPRALKFIRRKR